MLEKVKEDSREYIVFETTHQPDVQFILGIRAERAAAAIDSQRRDRNQDSQMPT